jgi:putative endonuclease
MPIAADFTGAEAEALACQYLQKQGLRLVTKNYRCRMGEIDLIMREKAILVFIEVRYRKNSHYGSSAESVNLAKQHKLLKTAHYYLQQNRLTDTIICRFDVCALSYLNGQTHIDWIKQAFSA